ncbi:nitrogen regulation protein NR(II) [Desulforhopalus sp. IMCC35007]|uniref:two-component system sensor histidine kinase NtrB n=1 Tax=Desulforhopalus sp. IMCC35007 TaxID=2569543 RepID=UPI0010AEC039|nr:ATP-binding protein [Desulforhopalus sp. IMCC35007]TKB10764.1 PAS domain S-box protein [Desulforhopalus sp. IMCC35007]
MREWISDRLTVVVCENFYREAAAVLVEQGWTDVVLNSFSARCGRPLLSVEEIDAIAPSHGEAVVLGGTCLQGLSSRDGLSFRIQENCFSYICSSSQLKQLLRERKYPVSSGGLREWRKSGNLLGYSRSQYQDFTSESANTIVFLDTLVDAGGNSTFTELLSYTGMKGERIEVGCDIFVLHLSSVVNQWRQKMSNTRLRQVLKQPFKSGQSSPHLLSSQSSMLLRVLDGFKPGTSRQAAVRQLVELFRMFMVLENVAVEIISNTVTEFRFEEDPAPVSLDSFSDAGVCETLSAEGFYLLVRVDEAKRAVIRVAGRPHTGDMSVCIHEILPFKGLIRLILDNAFLHDELRAEIVHKEQIEKYLEKSEHYFRVLYENAPLPYHCLDGSGRILEVNNAWLAILGYRKEEVLGQFFEHFLVQDHVQPYSVFQNRLPTSAEVSSIELEAVKSDSTVIQIQLDATLSRDQAGVIQQTHCIFVDVTAQNKIQELILQSEKLSTIAGLAAGIAHEINTPLSGIMQSAQLIGMFLDPGNEGSLKVAQEFGVDLWKFEEYSKHQELDYFINGIRTSALAASEIIKNLLEFSRPGKGEWEVVCVQRLFEQVINLVQSDYDLKKKYNVINVIFDTEHDAKLPSVYCVAVEMEQVFFNIIKNAVHAMGKAGTKNPRVLIRTGLRKNMVRIEIEDNGPGVQRETAKHVFDPFFTTKEPGEGTGLGLSIAYTIVKGTHQGDMWLDLDCKAGARFLVEIPADTSAKVMC